MEIPIQNIYYLLCYAWNKLVERDIVDVKGIETTKLCDLFAKVIITGTSRVLKMGLGRGYVQNAEEIYGIKGKIDFGLSLKRNTFRKAKCQCEYDELSYNILHNQILKSTIRRLADVNGLDQELKDKLIVLYRKLNEIDDIKVGKADFRRIQLYRNDSFYQFLLNICELVIDNLMPTEQKGRSKFRDFVRDDKQMAKLFEEFVRNFYKIEQDHFHVRREDIYWDITAGASDFIPKMQTDISLESKDGKTKIIIDTKYYSEALSEHYEKEKIKSANMYQMFSYLENLDATKEVNKNCTGILLYPTVTKELDIPIKIKEHPVQFKTINLNQEWPCIHKDLLAIIGL
jgi:5-methylcytosine-specific restriction enzyme subunit McrC